jgi:hypothetical protein
MPFTYPKIVTTQLFPQLTDRLTNSPHVSCYDVSIPVEAVDTGLPTRHATSLPDGPFRIWQGRYFQFLSENQFRAVIFMSCKRRFWHVVQAGPEVRTVRTQAPFCGYKHALNPRTSNPPSPNGDLDVTGTNGVTENLQNRMHRSCVWSQIQCGEYPEISPAT